MEKKYTNRNNDIPVLIDATENPCLLLRQESNCSSNSAQDSAPRNARKSVCDEDLKAVFTIDGEGYDVVLSVTRERIFWMAMSALVRRKSARKLSGMLRSRRASASEETTSEGVSLASLFGVYVKHQARTEKDTAGVCLGLVLCMVESKNENTLRERVIFLEHPSEELCTSWEKKIKRSIRAKHPERPVSIKLFLQPHAGNKAGLFTYQKTVLPLFHSAGVSVDLAEVIHNEYVKQQMIHLNLDDFDCIVCMGGDGTVSQVVNALMNRAQKEKEVEMKHGAQPAPSPLPLGIIPTGKTNNVVQSVMGVADPITAVLHIIHGHFQPVDLCSLYTPDKFLQWGFNCQYGFAGQVLTYIGRYKALGAKRVDAAFVKALTKAKLRAYECDIEYIPANVKSHVRDTPCRSGCHICWNSEIETEEKKEPTVDFVQELDSLNESFASNNSSLIDLHQDSPWQTLKGKYMNVGLFVLPGLCDLAPQGLSKFTHLNDGVIDLVLVRDVEKKEFVRHLRRHGNSKNQFDFPFIEIHKVTEVRFRPRFLLGWNYNNHEFNEIRYQMEREESKTQHQKSVEIISDLGHNKNFQRSKSVDIIDISDDGESYEKEDNENDGELKAVKPQLVGPQYRKTFHEIEMEKYRKHARQKEEKQKAKEEAKMVAVWNVDNQIVRTLALDFKIHHGLLKVCGLGVSPYTTYEDIRLGCLSAM
ncbi:unnamed protein product [Candidula unifasciata]|uniref:DAGKc domain-containing protein n=1 Tax=Candidula unifasciata TaxID=100452 RepID=A0A8S3ZYQ3_9EUPU|nr:unnamed protein product [Candidula unifasciata]